MARRPTTPGLTHLRVTVADDFYLGPGRADLLQFIAETGSISAAGKRMDMSYKRAWGLVQALNEGFGAPLVEASRGGSGQGGAVLTSAGQEILRLYRNMEAAAALAIATDLKAAQALRDEQSGRK